MVLPLDTMCDLSFNFIESQLAQEIIENPHFASGGPALRLSAIHARNKFAFDAYPFEAQEQFSSENPREAEAWQWLIIQRAPPPYRHDARWTSVRSAFTGMKETLQQNSNRVNARFFDHNGSLYIVFYNGGFADRTAFFEAGLNQGNLPNTLEIMTIASRMTLPNNSSLLLKRLRAQDDPWQEREFSQ